MSLTNRQRSILNNMSDLRRRKTMCGKMRFFLHGSDVSSTINSLIVKGLLAREVVGGRVALSEAVRNSLGTIAGS